MKRLWTGSFIGACALFLSQSAGAALFDRGGGLIYDDVLNITWLQDAKYASTSGKDSDGLFSWGDAMTWVGQLKYGGYDDWRLPTVKPVNGVSYNLNYSADGSTDYARNISYPGRTNPYDAPGAYPYSTQNELAYMFFVNLGNLASTKTDGTNRSGTRGIDFGLVNASFVDGLTGSTVSFVKGTVVLADDPVDIGFWSNIPIHVGPGNAFGFIHYKGFNDSAGKDNLLMAWAVRDGDVISTIPEPQTWVMLLAGLGVISAAVRWTRMRGRSLRV